ncbi:MAG: DUF2232 domain-containing protein [Alphaproteobacteria bacterium]|nr:DUF2232 domain-containing protein [Alphaproteobacteria bacterium]
MPWPIALALGGGAASALFALAATLGTPGALIFAYLTQLPLFAVGLSQGATFAAIAGAVAAAVLILAESGLFAAIFIALNAAPAWLLTRLALQSRTAPDGTVEWYPPGLLVTWLTTLAVAGLATAYLFFGGAEGGLPGAVERFLRTGLTLMVGGSEAQIEGAVRAVAPLFPSIVLVSWMIMVVVNGALAQGVLVRFGHNRRPTPRIADIELPRWALVPVAAALALAILGEGSPAHFGANLSLVLCLPFLFVGLAVVHAIARRQPLRWAILVGTYAVVMIFGWPAAALIILGFVEQWAGLRRRFGGPPPADRES